MCAQSRQTDALSFPAWAAGAQWGVKIHSRVHPEGCARQIRADFHRRFEGQLAKGHFPWGAPRKKEDPPVCVELPAHTDSIIQKLNTGPDLVASIADKEYALELPKGSRISWLRVAPDPITCDKLYLTGVVGALRRFEQVCNELLSCQEEVSSLLFAGVDVDPRVAEIYLHPSTSCFSVGRPDLHYTGNGTFASEIDEMPGGFAELVHIDNVYGINQERWEHCFQWLMKEGLLLFVVSHEWSKCYIPEMEWLARFLQSKGYPAAILTTDQLQQLTVEGKHIIYRGERVGTVWRQFPIFETRGKLAELVECAHQGMVRMVPEFAHYGNKTWFSIFRRYSAFFRGRLEPETYGLLEQVLPDSHLILSAESFPCVVAGKEIESLRALRGLPQEMRDRLVLKICGANTLSARSYGVLMGYGISEADWRDWVDAKMAARQPFLVQQHIGTSIARVPVRHTGRKYSELFSCRILIRPWVVDGVIISASAIAVPANTFRVHGRVDMAVLPIVFE